jgi:SAM-dependent methyltransferase
MSADYLAQVRADFDRIAELPEERWDHNLRYHRMLLRELPEPCARALEIGCGAGLFARELAARCGEVLALDLSPRMVERARQRLADVENVELRVQDVLEWEIPRESFDCIVSITTLHHLPMGEMLRRLRDGLRPGGVLLVLDVVGGRGPRDVALAGIALPLNRLLGLLHNGRLRPPPEVRAAWEEHGKTDRYLKLGEVRAFCRDLLPGARIRRHLFFRYSIAWRKPHSAATLP